MAARIPYHLPKFDRDAPHYVLRAFTLDADELKPGMPFDRTRVTVRLHRLLYEQRKIGPPEYLEEHLRPGSGTNGQNLTNSCPARRVEARPSKFGKWAVFEGEEKVSKLMDEAEARQAAEAMQP